MVVPNPPDLIYQVSTVILLKIVPIRLIKSIENSHVMEPFVAKLSSFLLSQSLLPPQVRIPSIPKRIAAEFIDCVILLVAKFLITFIAVEYFELIQLPR